VKFLCDRCKTRYSIGDDRVRGKILKIRCKNCANVITVREGMMADPDAPPIALEQPRLKKPTTGAPESLNELEARAREPARTDRSRGGEPEDRSSGSGARDHAGARRGADAGRGQAAGKRAHDDRRMPIVGSGDPDGSAAGSPKGGAILPRGIDRRAEPVSALNAAFASAMAKPPPALEEEWYVSIDGEQEGPFSLAEAQHWVTQKPFDAELHCWSEGFDDWLPVDKVSHFRGLRKRPPPAVAPPPLPRTAGATPRPGGPTPVPVVEDEPKPLFAATMASLERGAPAVSNPAIALPVATPPARATPARGSPIAARTNGARNAAVPVIAPAVALDPRAPDPRAGMPSGSSSPARSKPISESFDPGDSDAITQFGPVPPPEPFVKPRRDEPARNWPDLSKHAFGEPAPGAAPAELEGGDDHELAIGEVSRVVNLADIVRDRENATRRSGINPTFRSTGAIASMAAFGVDGTPATQGAGEPGTATAPVAKSHRRGLITLFSVAVLMVLGVIGAVILLVTTEDEPIGGKLGPVHDIDTSRPEDPITHRPLGSGATIPAPPNPLPRILPRPRVSPNPPAGSSQDPDPLPGNSLSADEVEDMARKHQEITNRCYMRSQRGADSILIGDVKKISVTLTVDSDGTVSDLKFSEHGADNLGKCLTIAIKGWRFRQSAGGTFRFSLNFVGS
jgi:predicted Zn finger-like uncharacterized protein